jgi:hypothetical protein
MCAAAALVLAGCAAQGGLAWSSYGPGPLRPGDLRAQVIDRMGEPTQQLQQGNGHRLVYVRGPFGRHTWFIDIAADGRVQTVEQTLTPARFAAVVPGMSSEELLAWLGPTSRAKPLALDGRSLWNWRFETFECLWFAVTLDRNNKVLDAGYTPDPLCDFKEPR